MLDINKAWEYREHKITSNKGVCPRLLKGLEASRPYEVNINKSHVDDSMRLIVIVVTAGYSSE